MCSIIRSNSKSSCSGCCHHHSIASTTTSITIRSLFIFIFIIIGSLTTTIDCRRSSRPSSSTENDFIGNSRNIGGGRGGAILDIDPDEYASSIEEDDFDCPEKYGYYPDVTNCSRYHICDHGKSALKSCDDGLVFSTILKTCDWPYNVHCNLANGDRGDYVGKHLRLRGENGDIGDNESGDLSLSNRRQPVLTNEADDSYWLGRPDSDLLAYLNDEDSDYHDHYSTNDREYDIPRRKVQNPTNHHRNENEPADDEENLGGVSGGGNDQPWFENFEHARRRTNQRPTSTSTTTTSAPPSISTNQRGTTGWRHRSRPINQTPAPPTTTLPTPPPTPLLPRRALRIGGGAGTNSAEIDDGGDDYLLTDDPGNALINNNDNDNDYRRQNFKDDRDSYRIVSHNRPHHQPLTTVTTPTPPTTVPTPPRLPPWTQPPPAIHNNNNFGPSTTSPSPSGTFLGSQPRHLGTSVRRKVLRKKIVSQSSLTTLPPTTPVPTTTAAVTTSAPSFRNNWNPTNSNSNNNNDPWQAFRYETVNRTNSHNNHNNNNNNNADGPHKISSIRRTIPKLDNRQRFERKPVLRDDHEENPEDNHHHHGIIPPVSRGGYNDAEDESYFYNTPEIIRHRSAGPNSSLVRDDDDLIIPRNVVKDVSNNIGSSGRGYPVSNVRSTQRPNTQNQFLNKAFDLGFHHAINPLNNPPPPSPHVPSRTIGGADIEYEDLENEDEDENVDEASDENDDNNNNSGAGSINNNNNNHRGPLNKEIVVRYDDDESDDPIVNDPRRAHHNNQTRFATLAPRLNNNNNFRVTPTPSPPRYTRFIDQPLSNNNFNQLPNSTISKPKKLNSVFDINRTSSTSNNKSSSSTISSSGNNANKKQKVENDQEYQKSTVTFTFDDAIRIVDITPTITNHHQLQNLAPILPPANIPFHHHNEPHEHLPNPVPFVTIIGPLNKNNKFKKNNITSNNIHTTTNDNDNFSSRTNQFSPYSTTVPRNNNQASRSQSIPPPLPSPQLSPNQLNSWQNSPPPQAASGPMVKPVPITKKIKTNKKMKTLQNQSNNFNSNNRSSKSMKNLMYPRAKRCVPEKCQPPNCWCGGTSVPGGFEPKEIPQIVLLTFDDSVNDLNREIYRRLFEQGRTNPNGCPISATFYVSHEWTDYSQVQNLYAKGHEIASHSISHSFGEKFSKERWLNEILGQKEILHLYGGVDANEIRGMRAPFLQTGGDTMFEMLHQANFSYDSSLPVYDIDPPYWPYTLDFAIGHDCMIEPCPSNSYPGFWEVGMVMWEDLRGGRCSMADGCFNPSDEQGVYEMVKANFLRHYTSNRAPFGMYFHSRWFLTEHNMNGFIRFLDEMLQMDDIYLVTNWQMIQWMRQPTPLSHIKQFKPFGCDYIRQRPPLCKAPHTCKAKFRGEVRTLKTCQQCPQTYPWTGNNGSR